jgi:hypothetical protein
VKLRRAHNPKSEIILISGWGDKKLDDLAYALDVPLLHKPFATRALSTLVRGSIYTPHE